MKVIISTLLFCTTLFGQESVIPSTEHNFNENESVFSSKINFQKDFFAGNPKDIIFKLVDKNRNAEHRSRFSLLYELEAQYTFNKRSTISYSHKSSGCYNPRELYTFINIEKDNSYIVFNRSGFSEIICCNFENYSESIKLVYKKIDFETAKYIDETFFWLNKLNTVNNKTEKPFTMSSMSTTADGQGYLKIHSPKVKSIIKSTVWVNSFEKRWSTHLNGEAKVNFTDLIIREAIIQKFTPILHPKNSNQEFAELVLTDCSPDPRFPYEITSNCLNLIDKNPDFDPQIIRNITKNYKPNQTFLEKLKDAKLLSLPENPDFRILTKKQQNLLRSEDYKLIKLIEKCNETLHKLSIIKDENALFKLATSKGNLHEWALLKLKEYPDLYVKALIYLLDKKDPKHYSRIFHEILRVNRPKAIELATKNKNLNDPQFQKTRLRLQEEEKQKLLDKKNSDKLRSLSVNDLRKLFLKVINNNEADWEVRTKAISELVPINEPLRDSHKDIDSTLLKLLDIERDSTIADWDTAFLQTAASTTLAYRQNVKAWPKIIKLINIEADDTEIITEHFSALVYLYLKKPTEEWKNELTRELKKNLLERKTNFQSLAMLAWVLNFKELNQELIKLSQGKNSPSVILSLTQTLSQRKPFEKAEKLMDLYVIKTPLKVTSTLVKNKIYEELLETKSKMSKSDWVFLENSSKRARIIISKMHKTNE
ncbi:MAG: hypothetical protein NE330_17935 [Lentisphaeraceae bacterium]|nr:hypothetical protein [Lentisphaeraceae bacterium]